VKILLYSANFTPEPTGVGKYSGEMAAWFVRRGHEVRAIVALPYYPQWRIAESDRWPPYRRERLDAVDVWRCPIWVPGNPSAITRVLHLWSFAMSSLPVVLISSCWRPDVVMTVAPFLTCAPGGWLTARVAGARAWLHLQDFEVDAAFELGILNGSRARRMVLAFEGWLLRRFDVVSTISNRMMARLHLKGLPERATLFFPNWVDTDAIRPLASTSTFRAELGIGADTIVALFSGTLGYKQALPVISKAAARLQGRRDVLFIICGDGPMKANLQEACSRLPNLRLLPLQPAERLCELLNLADIHLLTQSREAEDLVLPSKLGGMLASGRPIVATCRAGTEIAAVIAECGEIVPPDDDSALAATVERLANEPQRRSMLGTAAREYAQRNLAIDAVLRRIESELKGPDRGTVTIATHDDDADRASDGLRPIADDRRRADG
jgi:colanic acid biosynthesis glycosyl transferase WcaI